MNIKPENNEHPKEIDGMINAEEEKDEESLKKRKQINFGISSTGYKKNAEIILDVKTVRLIRQIFKNKWSVNWKTRENLDKCLSDHIEMCTKW